MSEAVVANKHDARFIVGYEVEPGRIVPLCIKTPKDCLSSGVSRFNEASPWKMGFNVSEDEAWVGQYEGIWWQINANFCMRLVVEDLSLVEPFDRRTAKQRANM